MFQPRKAVYAGMFDPWTSGHSHVLEQAAPLFDHIILGVGVNPAKKPMFSIQDRLEMMYDMTENIQAKTILQVEECVSGPGGEYLINYTERMGASCLIRGLRNSSDFEYELGLAQVNYKINPRVRTVFFMADRAYADISSSTVKALIGPVGWESQVKEYIPNSICDRFISLVKKTHLLDNPAAMR